MTLSRALLAAPALALCLAGAAFAQITRSDVTQSLEGQGFDQIRFADSNGEVMVVHAARDGTSVTIVYDRDTGAVRQVSGRDGAGSQAGAAASQDAPRNQPAADPKPGTADGARSREQSDQPDGARNDPGRDRADRPDRAPRDPGRNDVGGGDRADDNSSSGDGRGSRGARSDSAKGGDRADRSKGDALAR